MLENPKEREPQNPFLIYLRYDQLRIWTVNHVRNKNVAYLLGVLIAHMLGLLEKVWGYGSGMC